jgi:hypothetical protein
MRYVQFALIVLALAIAACSGERDKNKFKDLDRPKSAEKR